MGVTTRSFPPHPNPLPCLRRSGFAQAGPRGEGRPFIPPAKLGGILTHFDELPRRKQRGIKNFKFCHSALDAESSRVFWIPASAGMTNSPQAAGNTTRRDLKLQEHGLVHHPVQAPGLP